MHAGVIDTLQIYIVGTSGINDNASLWRLLRRDGKSTTLEHPLLTSSISLYFMTQRNRTTSQTRLMKHLGPSHTPPLNLAIGNTAGEDHEVYYQYTT